MRTAIKDFALANRLYAGATVTFYTVSGGAKTATKATLYVGPTGSSTLGNPQVLGSDGKLRRAVYVDVPTIATVSGLTIPDHDTGIINPAPSFRINSSTYELEYSYDNGSTWTSSNSTLFKHRGAWVTGTAYARTDTFTDSGTLYYTATAHTAAASLATDVSAGRVVAMSSLSLPLSLTNGGLGASHANVAAVRSTLGLASMALEAKTITTKGDLLVGGAAGALARRAVGTDGQVLTADSAETDGVKWATPAAAAAATQSEMEAASSNAVFVSPGRAHFHPGVAKAWAGNNSATLQDTYNVSSLTNNGTGDYTYNFTNSLSTSTYAVVVSGSGDRATPLTYTRAVGSFRVSWIRTNDSTAQASGASGMAVFGDFA